MELKEHIGSNVRDLRKALGLSQAELGSEMAERGFPWIRQTVQETEGGRRDLTVEELLGLSALFDVPLARLVGRLEPRFGADPKDVFVGGEYLSVDEVAERVARDPGDVDQESFAERRQKTLEARPIAPGPIYLWEGEGDLSIGTAIPPWGASVVVTLAPGVPYTARDDYEAEELQAIIDERRRGLRGTLRVIDRQEAYRIRRRLRGAHQEG